MTIETDLRATVQRASTDSLLLHGIVHGKADETVDTEGGAVKTAAKAIADLEAAYKASSMLTRVTAAKDAAAASATAAANSASSAADTVASLNLPVPSSAHAEKALAVKADGSGYELVPFTDADTLDGQHGAWYQDLANATGTLPSGRLSGQYAINITGNADTASRASSANTSGYATSAGDADTLDGLHANAFARAGQTEGVQDIRFGAKTTQSWPAPDSDGRGGGADPGIPPGYVVDVPQYRFYSVYRRTIKPLQKRVNGVWYTVAQA